ncbi:hypothetical protein TARUN_2881 [Trichoderma arundinaceum]|uniref:Duf1665 domain containing protein n=1 Tax=Trichoderma arundinaceum TaxID=490622 RepID=A0A395NTQ4_TRIAR|nr:hypothetical protein TARUN_2881 [Trichoderma arundinaceum]
MPPLYPIGLPRGRGAASDILPIREVAMMLLMESLTDKPNWHEKVFDEGIVQKWREEAMTQPENGLFSRIMEGKWYTEDIPLPKSRIISEKAFEFCIAELRNKAAYFVKTGMIPTLDSAGNTIVKSDTLISSGLRDELIKAFETLRADQAANVDWQPRSNDMVQNLIHPSMYPFVYGRSKFLDEEEVGTENALEFIGKGRIVPEITVLPDYGLRFIDFFWEMKHMGTVPTDFRSSLYQWLPANVGFREDGTAKITSYVNNLHPGKYPAIYEAIEHAIDVALPAWEQCLRENTGDEDDTLWTRTMQYKIPRVAREWRSRYIYGSPPKPSIGENKLPGEWAEGRDAILPEPVEFEDIDYSPPERLREKFKEHGLQVIVKMASIELTPEKPDFHSGSWHVEGQANEKICATALFYLDSENVTDSYLSFRVSTRDDLEEVMDHGQDQYNYLERVYGTSLGDGGSCLQNFGDVKTPQGRLLAFPNVFQHRVSSLRLKDPTKPGHRRFLALWLVDPHERVISTANVPPQQKDWWIEASGGGDAGEKDIPESLLTVEEAQEHRLKLMDDRTKYETTAERTWSRFSYNFCEH